MPKGIPLPDVLTNRSVSAFCLDTSVVESEGFRFETGPLRRLANQLPPWMQLWMPDIVVREISRHRLEHVGRAAQQILSASQDLRRYIGESFAEDMSWVEAARTRAIDLFDAQFTYFLNAHDGIVLEPTHPRLSTELFNSYFQGRPPFGVGRDKKHEFPDAGALLMLDMLARERDLYVIVVSKDEGWKAYAEQSARLFCVSSLQELTALFVADTQEARSIRKRLGELFSRPGTDLRNIVKSTLENNLLSLPWAFKLPLFLRTHVDVAVTEASLKSFSFPADAVGVWVTSSNNDFCIAEISIDVDVILKVEAILFKHDGRGEKLDLETVDRLIEQSFELKVLIEMHGPLQSGQPEVMIEKMEIGATAIDVVLRDDDLGFALKGEFAHEWDDIPF